MKDAFDVIVVGAGAAGLFCAYSAGSRGKNVLVLEAGDRPGKKVLISGGGRCNFTNIHMGPEYFVSSNPHFCKSALGQFNQNDFLKQVKDHKIEYYEKTLGQLFCKKSSKEILNLLLSLVESVHGEIKMSCLVENVSYDGVFQLKTNHGLLKAKSLVVATGGLSFPNLGATDWGYKLAEQFGHGIQALSPALDGFVFGESEKSMFKDLPGLSVSVNLKVQDKSFEENVLFTHVGLSGPAALKGSLFWYPEQPVTLDFLPQVSDFEVWLHEERNQCGKKQIANWLSAFLPQNLVFVLVKNLDIRNQKLAELSGKNAKRLKILLKEFSFVPTGTVGYAKAEVTRGGVDTNDVSSKTMESKLQKGLFFVGEVLDVTGLLGGYNFQWAWSSGWVAGQNA